MFITIELKSGSNGDRVTKSDIQKNIDALIRSIHNTKLSVDDVLLIDTKSILEGIKDQLPYQ